MEGERKKTGWLLSLVALAALALYVGTSSPVSKYVPT